MSVSPRNGDKRKLTRLLCFQDHTEYRMAGTTEAFDSDSTVSVRSDLKIDRRSLNLSARWAARRVPRAKDGGVPHAQVDLAAYWWDPASPMVCTARWALTSVLFGARVAEISLQCPRPLAGSDMSSRAWSHWLWCTARLVHRGQTCVMCRWRLASGVATILKA